MRENQRMKVRHSKYGKGYVFVIAEDYFTVKFRLRKQREFPFSAFDDGTLSASEETVKQFKARHKALVNQKTR